MRHDAKSFAFMYPDSAAQGLQHWQYHYWTVNPSGAEDHSFLGPGLLREFHVKIYVKSQGFSNMASDWLAAVLPANQMPGLKIFGFPLR